MQSWPLGFALVTGNQHTYYATAHSRYAAGDCLHDQQHACLVGKICTWAYTLMIVPEPFNTRVIKKIIDLVLYWN